MAGARLPTVAKDLKQMQIGPETNGVNASRRPKNDRGQVDRSEI